MSFAKFRGRCPHERFYEIQNHGGDLIAKQCRVCLEVFDLEEGSRCALCDPRGCTGKCSISAQKILARKS